MKAQIAEDDSASVPSPRSATPRIQVDYSSEGAVQSKVSLDGSIINTEDGFASFVGTDAIVDSVLETDVSEVSCQIFSDAECKKTSETPGIGRGTRGGKEEGIAERIKGQDCRIDIA